MNYARKSILSITVVVTAASFTFLPASAHSVQIPSVTAVGAAAAVSPVKQAENQLKIMGEAIHRAKSAAADLVRECSRENTMMAGGEIDFIGTDVIPILPDTAEGLGGSSYFPPRKQYLDLHMGQLLSLMPILQQDIQATKSPDPAQAQQTAADQDAMTGFYSDAMVHINTLKTLTATQPYDATSIINEAQAVHKDVSEIDKLRKKVYTAIKRDPNDKAIDQAASGK
jgi:hypothetical protein